MRSSLMLMTPELCRAARALIDWDVPQLARASGVSEEAVEQFEAGRVVPHEAVEALLQALLDAGLEFIAAGAKSHDGGPGLRTIPLAEPEVTAAEEAVELDPESASEND